MAKATPPNRNQGDDDINIGAQGKSALALELEREASLNDGKTTAGVALNTGDKPPPHVPLPGAGSLPGPEALPGAGTASAAILPQGSNPLDATRTGAQGPLPDAGDRPDAAPNRPIVRELTAQERASWEAFGRHHGLLDKDGKPLAAPEAPAAITTASPVSAAAPTRPALATKAPMGAPPCPPMTEDNGDKTRDFFVWQCRYNEDLNAVVQHYQGRKIGGELITESVIRRVRKSRD